MEKYSTISVLAIKDSKGELQAIVYSDTSRRAQIFYKCNEATKDEIMELLNGSMPEIK